MNLNNCNCGEKPVVEERILDGSAAVMEICCKDKVCGSLHHSFGWPATQAQIDHEKARIEKAWNDLYVR